MGTRADFYIGRGEKAEWLGSLCYDGYPNGVPEDVLRNSHTEQEWRANVAKLLAGEESATIPEQGWPWPWEDSRTTDYAYAWDDGTPWISSYGHAWYRADSPDPDQDEDERTAVFPNMKNRQKVAFGKRSGFLILALPVEEEGERS